MTHETYPRYVLTCAICGADEYASDRFDRRFKGKGRHISPICWHCEWAWGSAGYDWTGHPRKTHVKGGTYTDRRLAVQIKAITAALSAEATCRGSVLQYGNS